MIRASRPIPQATVKIRSSSGGDRRVVHHRRPARQPEVQSTHAAVADRFEAGPDAADADRGGQDVAGPGRHDRQRRLTTDERRGRFADRPVATDDDHERRLGRRRERRARRLERPVLDHGRRAGPVPDRAVTSPTIRARRSAECSFEARGLTRIKGSPRERPTVRSPTGPRRPARFGHRR